MRSTIVALAFGLAATVAAQSIIPGLPKCAESCLIDGLAKTGCQLTDFKCSCTNEAFVKGSAICVQGACQDADRQKAIQVAASICAQAGVTLPTTYPAEPTSTGAATYPTSAPATTATGYPTTAPPPNYPTGIITSKAPIGSGYPTPTYGGNGTVTASRTPTASVPPAGGAATRFGASVGVVGVAIAGFLML